MAHGTDILDREPDAGTAREPVGLYDRDFHAWTLEQAAAIRGGRLSEIDVDNLAEEIEDSGRSVFNGLESAFRLLLLQLLKWDHQPERRSRSWAGSIRIQRLDIERVLSQNPSLRPRQPEAVHDAYQRARIEAAGEMDRPERSLPAACPYPLDEILNRPVTWPDD